MKQLRGLIAEQAIHAVFLYHPDRTPDKPAHRLLFRALCEEFKVSVRCCHGQIPEGDMGEVMEFLDAWAKEKQVRRTQQGVRDGLRDRVKVKGLPANNKPPYGYHFRFIEVDRKQIPVALEPSLTYPVLKLIWEGFLQGKAIRGICHELVINNVPSPGGGTAWYPGTVYTILTNPVYAGRYYALRSFSREPKTRLKDTYGKSARGQLPFNEGHWLEDFPIESPVVTWEQFQAAQERLKLNKAESRRKSKRLFILSGILFCGQCGNRMVGFSGGNRGNYHGYRCSAHYGARLGMKSCPARDVNGPFVDSLVWDRLTAFLSNPELFMAEMGRRTTDQESSKTDSNQQMDDLEKRLQKVDAMDTELVAMKLRGETTQVVYDRNLALNRAERTHIKEEIARAQAILATYQETKEATASLIALHSQVKDKLGSATPEEKRWLLQTLDVQVTAGQDEFNIQLGVPPQFLDTPFCTTDREV